MLFWMLAGGRSGWRFIPKLLHIIPSVLPNYRSRIQVIEDLCCAEKPRALSAAAGVFHRAGKAFEFAAGEDEKGLPQRKSFMDKLKQVFAGEEKV